MIPRAPQTDDLSPRMRNLPSIWFWLALSAVILISRLCHCGILWSDEDYHIAAAIQALHGKIPYRDFFYDKPILNLTFYWIAGAPVGCFLRLIGAVYGIALCLLMFHFASRIWARREGYIAASLLAFFIIFYFPGANISLQPDTLMIAPHMAAVYFAWFRRPFSAGIAAGLAFLFNTKGIFVLAACMLFGGYGLPLLFLGFALPNAILVGWLYMNGAVTDYWQQVWQWGFHYIETPVLKSPLYGFRKILNWTGFHFSLAFGAGFTWLKEHRLHIQLCGWTALSLIAVLIGWRFGTHYFNQVLPPLVLSAAHGISLLIQARSCGIRIKVVYILLLISLAIPCIRFGRSYVLLAGDRLLGIPYNWKDLTMDQAGRQIAQTIKSITSQDDTIFIWGHFPKIIAYTRLSVASRFLDSQPLTGIPADWHLESNGPIVDKQASIYRQELLHSKPTIVVDELGVLNPNLDIRKYPELRPWLASYCLEHSLPMAHIYKRCPSMNASK